MIGYTLCTKHTYEMYKQSCCIHLCLCSSPVSHDICRIDNIVTHPYKLQLSITEFEKNYVSIIINVFTEIEEKDLKCMICYKYTLFLCQHWLFPQKAVSGTLSVKPY